MLSHLGESRATWNGYLRHEREQLDACGKGSYRITLSRKDFGHASFSDGPTLNAASGSPQESTAPQNLAFAEKLIREFLDKNLKGQTAPLLDGVAISPSGMTVEPVGR